MCCMFTDIPLEQDRHSGGLPNILTAAHSLTEGGKEIQREKETENILLSNAAFDFFFFLMLDFTFFSPWIFSDILQNYFLLLTITRAVLVFCQWVQSQLSYLWRCCERVFPVRIPDASYLADMARGIESLVSLNPFCSMDSAQGGHSDNCKFWLLDLGRCCNAWGKNCLGHK